MTVELGIARGVDAESFGQPGERTFRMRIVGWRNDYASLWMEKEQLQALSLAFTQMLSQLGRDTETAGAGIDEFPDVADHDFRVGRMAIGFDSTDSSIILQMFQVEADENDEPALSVRLRPEHCSSLNRQLRRIIAAGRPLCPLCSSPIDATGHVCVRSNGHLEQPIPGPLEEEE